MNQVYLLNLGCKNGSEILSENQNIFISVYHRTVAAHYIGQASSIFTFNKDATYISVHVIV